MSPRWLEALILALGLLIIPFPVEGQTSTKKMARIGLLGLGPYRAVYLESFRQGLREAGYTEGQSIVIEPPLVADKETSLPALAAELVQRRVDVIVAYTTPGALAAKRATATIPVVMAASGDALGSGVIASLARPGGNVTGLSYMLPELGPKFAQLLKELVPKATYLAFLASSTYPPEPLTFREFQAAAQAMGMNAHFTESRGPKGIEGAFADMVRWQADAAFVISNTTSRGNRQSIVGLAAKHRIPAGYGSREFVEAGGLMSYGPSFPELWRRAAHYVDKILKGVKPADLPVEQPTRFELVVNLKTAKTLGITIPPSILIRADTVVP